MNQTSPSPLDGIRNTVEPLIKAGRSDVQIAEYINADPGHFSSVKTTARSVTRARKRWGFGESASQPKAEKAYTKIDGDKAEVVTDPRAWKTPLNDTESLLKERGLDPEEWEVKSMIVNEWDSVGADGVTLKQFKLHLVRKKPFHMVVPARIKLEIPRRVTAPVVPTMTDPARYVFVGDQQAPFHDTHLHSLFLRWLADWEPDYGVLMGDGPDFNTISRHPDEPEWAAEVQVCVDAYGQIVYDYTQASLDTTWRKLPGNHDERIRRAVIDKLGRFYGLKPAQIEGMEDLPPIHDLSYLFRLDEMGVEFIRPKGSYEHSSLKVCKDLTARHGWLARAGSGKSAHATLDHLGHSVIIGHTHRQGKVYQTKHDSDGRPHTITAVETGCMCRIEGGLGYAVAPDWQNGFATATVWPDGKFDLQLATYVNGTLLYGDYRYS